MKRVITLLVFLTILILPAISAEMIINQQPSKLYNLGDSVSVPITVKSIGGISGIFSMDLFCGTKQFNFYKNGVNLLPGEEKVMDASLVLTKDILGESVGTCKIKGILGSEYILTQEFKISNLIILQPNTEQIEFEPGQSFLIFGGALKENGQPANGFIELEIVTANSSQYNILQKGTINNGMYSMNITLPENMKAGKYLVKLNAYEVALDTSRTNKGFVNYNIQVKQIPTSLELLLKDEEIEPGKQVEVKAILHDQTGESIDATATITIKRGLSEIVEGGGPTEKKTGEYMKLDIAYNEAPGNWTVFAISNQLTAETKFTVLKKEEINVERTNQSLIVKNTGNIPYNGTIIIKIGEISKDFTLFLPVDATNKYDLKTEFAGEYEVQLIDKEGNNKFTESIVLPESKVSGATGFAIRDSSESSDLLLFTRPIFWIFVGIIILAVLFIFIRKHRKNRFGGNNNLNFKKKIFQPQPKVNTAWENREIPLSKESKLQTKNKANLSISIKGNKQDVSLTMVSVRNLAELQSKKSNPEEPLQKIINLAESKKAFIYENQNNLAFIFVPSKTKTLKNETSALEIAQEAKDIISNYNRVAKYKMDFGISLEYGSILEKTENGIMQFMSLETLMTNIKKIAALSKGEILFGEEIRNKLTSVRTEKFENERISCYKMKDIKYYDAGHSRYMENFMKKAGEKGITPQTTVQNKIETKPSQNQNTSTDPKSLIRGFY